MTIAHFPAGRVVTTIAQNQTMTGDWLTVYVRNGTHAEEAARQTLVTQVLLPFGFDDIAEGNEQLAHDQIHQNGMMIGYGVAEYVWLHNNLAAYHKHYRYIRPHGPMTSWSAASTALRSLIISTNIARGHWALDP
jgi:hypothetical protein